MPAPQTPWEQMVDDAHAACEAVFGEGDEQVTITHYGGSAYTANGIFDAESIQVDPDTGVEVISNQPVMSFRLSLLQEHPDDGDTVVIRGVTYRVIEPMGDGQGTVTVRLHRVSA